jgi:predicted transcriptional regulator
LDPKNYQYRKFNIIVNIINQGKIKIDIILKPAGLVRIMRKKIIIILITIILLTEFIIVGAEPDKAQVEKTNDQIKDVTSTNNPQDQNKLFEELITNPDFFIENKGQLSNEDIKYYSPDGSTWFTAGAVWLKPWQDDTANISMVLKHEFIGAQNSVPRAYQQLETYSNFYYGNLESNWSTGVHHYKVVYYENLYDGIDLRYYSVGSGLKYEFIVHPGSDPSQIRLRYLGTDKVEINELGELILKTPVGDFVDGDLLIYQDQFNNRETIQGRFVAFNDEEYGFEILQVYDSHEILIIDPLLEYSALLGRNTYAQSRDIKVDSQGNSYIFGHADFDDFPTTPGVINETPIGGSDLVILKLGPDSSKLIYSTYLGGSKTEVSYSMALDLSGNVYLYGYTESNDFPTTANAFDKDLNGVREIYISKLNPNATKLEYSTYINGEGSGNYMGITVDSAGCVYATGHTNSKEFPTTPGAYNNSNSSVTNIYVLKLNQSGSSLDYSALIGGNTSDYGHDIALDSKGNAHVIGKASSTDFPITDDAIDNNNSDRNDLVYFKLNHNGSKLLYSTYFGGSGLETGTAITLDKKDDVYITGFTGSQNFQTTTNAHSSALTGAYDVFVIKLNTSVPKLAFSTLVGGSWQDKGNEIVVDSKGNSYVTGYTESYDFPTTLDVSKHQKEGMYDGFIFKLDPEGSILLHSRYIGGSQTEYIYGMTLDQFNDNDIYITGFTNSTDFYTTPGENSSISKDGWSIFVQRYNTQPYIKLISLSMPQESTPAVFYPRLQPYNFQVNLIDSMAGQNLKDVILKLDPLGENIQLGWNYATGKFFESSDPKNYVEISPTSRYQNYYPTGWKIDFKIIFNWTYPSELLHDVQAFVTSNSVLPVWLDETNMFRVENDLVFVGELFVRGEDGRHLESLENNQSTLVAGGEKLKWTGLTPIYENSNIIYPPKEEFDISIFDENGLSWTDSPESGKSFFIETISPNNSYGSYNYSVKITGIPETSDSSNVNFTIKIDGDSVVFSNFTPDINSYQREDDITVGISITDLGGGLVSGSSVRYSYSFDNGSTWSSWLPLPKLESARYINPKVRIYFEEGTNNLVKWRAEDSMGNGLVESEEFMVKIDKIPVKFTDPFPEEDDTSLIDQVDVGISISDLTSGVDASTIEYSLSYNYGGTWSLWKPISGLEDGSKVNVRLTLKLPNGTANRIKWRAIDKAGNGPFESEEYKIQVNTWKFISIPRVFPNSPDNGSKVNSITPSLGWLLQYSGTYSVTYDIYFGKLPNPKLLIRKYNGTKYTFDIDLENGATYYWKIVPRANGFIGPESPVWMFTIDTGYLPIFDLKISPENQKIELRQGMNGTASIFVTNLGEINERISVMVQNDNKSNGLNIELFNPNGFEILSNGKLELQFNIKLDGKTSVGEYTVIILIYSQRAVEYGLELERSIQITVEVLEKPGDGPDNSYENNYLNYLYFLIIVLIILLVLIFIRIESRKILANFQRKAIYELIKEKPGIHFRSVMRALSLKPGTVAYHINVLEKQNYIKSIQKGIYRCFYPEGMKTGLKIKLTKLQQSIVFTIDKNPGISSTELSKSLNKNRMVLHYNTKVLQERGIIKKEKLGRSNRFYLTAITSYHLELW